MTRSMTTPGDSGIRIQDIRELQNSLDGIRKTLENIEDALIVIMHFAVYERRPTDPVFTADIMDRYRRLVEK